MGYQYFPIEAMPAPGTMIWCRWPYAEDKGAPGQDSRVVLVRKTIVLEDLDGITYGALTVSYGTGVMHKYDRDVDLFLEDRSEWEAAGLHKPTCFSLRENNKKTYPWCSEYFAPQKYVLGAPLIAGSLTEIQRDRLRECLRRRAALRR